MLECLNDFAYDIHCTLNVIQATVMPIQATVGFIEQTSCNFPIQLARWNGDHSLLAQSSQSE
jgi:hypothetical protein